MPDTTLRDLLLRRLDADTTPEDEWSALVLAALEGETELTKLLDQAGSAERKPQATVSPEPTKEPEPPRVAFLKSISVEGFRGIGPKATLDLTPDYLGDSRVAGRASHAWFSLTRACHHHPYQLSAGLDELKTWLEAVASTLAATERPAIGGQRAR